MQVYKIISSRWHIAALVLFSCCCLSTSCAKDEGESMIMLNPDPEDASGNAFQDATSDTQTGSGSNDTSIADVGTEDTMPMNDVSNQDDTRPEADSAVSDTDGEDVAVDAAADAAPDTGLDVSNDAATDATDSSIDAAPDTELDVAIDATDASMDVVSDTDLDAMDSSSDVAMGDAATDTGLDASDADADAAADMGIDVPIDAPDVAMDAAPDTTVDLGIDVSIDVSVDADATTDASDADADVATDAAVDMGIDVASDAPDSSMDVASDTTNDATDLGPDVSDTSTSDTNGGMGSFADDFEGDRELVGYTTNNFDALPGVAQFDGRYWAPLTDNTNNVTLHFNDDQGRLDAKLLRFPFDVVARNIGIGTEADSQVPASADGNPYLFAGIQVHVTDLDDRNSSHVVVGHRGPTHFTIEGKHTINSNSRVNDAGANIVPDGRADLRIVGNADRTLTVYWQVPNRAPNTIRDDWTLYRGNGELPGDTPAYGEEVYVGLITYAFGSRGVPFVGTCDGLEGGSLP